ncbi:MAG: glycosyltransferase [Chloroflexi bacterium]|nr:MAG: glycosyltransferase [Chloroflexota bacterium]
MTSLCLGVLGAAVAFALYTYLGYPLLLMLLTVLRRKRPPVAPLAEWPMITIVLPVFNEEAVIRNTLENLLQLDYPADRRQILVLSDASTDRTDAIVSEYATRGVQLLRLPRRRGKTAAENAALALLRGELIVNTDASVYVERGALKPLIASLADPTVGVASGHGVSVAPSQEHANRADSWYIGYEMWVRDLETRVSGIVGAAGCFHAVRAPIQRHALPEALSRDFAAALLARERGLRAVSVREALCFIPRVPSLRREYRRKVRTITRGWHTLYFKRPLLNPFRYGAFSWILAVALATLVCLARSAPWALWGLGLAAFAGVCAALAWWWPEGRRFPRVLAVPAYIVIGNLAALHAFVRAVRGERVPLWEPTRREAVRPAEG